MLKTQVSVLKTFNIMDGGDLTSTPMSAKPTFWGQALYEL